MPILLTFYSQFLKIVYKEHGKAESDSWLLLTNSNEALEQLWTVWVQKHSFFHKPAKVNPRYFIQIYITGSRYDYHVQNILLHTLI